VDYTQNVVVASYIAGRRFAASANRERGVPLKSLGRVIRSVQAFGRELSRKPGVTGSGAVPSIGVALGGGFARGIAHIGVLKVLEEEGIAIECIAGTSVGALIGAAYCSGLSVDELIEVAYKVRFTSFARWTLSRFGFATNDRMVAFLTRLLKVKTFEELRIPLGVTATEFSTGEGELFQTGSLIGPVRASCAYPGMFLPVDVDGRWFVDGMLSHPVPTIPVRQMGAERVLAVHLKGQWCSQSAPRHLFDVIGQSFAIAQDRMSDRWRQGADLVIEPDVAGFGYDDFKRAGELLKVGEVAMRRAMPEVRKWFETRLDERATPRFRQAIAVADPAPIAGD
jgi:NTE family protein